MTTVQPLAATAERESGGLARPLNAGPSGREPTGADPPRFWWLKRGGVGTFLLLVALTAVRLVWGWESQRRLERILDPVVARGEPLRVSQLEQPKLDDKVNGLAYLRNAAGAVNRGAWSPSNTGMNFDAAYTPYSPNWHAVAGPSVAANAKVFPLARQARAQDKFDFGVTFATPAVVTSPGPLDPLRILANTLRDSAEWAHEMGDDAAALETIRDMRHESVALWSQPFIIDELVGIGIDQSANAMILEIAPGLRIIDGAAPPPPVSATAGPFPPAAPLSAPRGVTRANVHRLIDELLDDIAANQGMNRALAGERVVHLDAAEHVARFAPVLRPMFELDAVRMLEVDAILEDAASKPDWPAASAVMVRAPVWPTTAPSAGRRQPIDHTRTLGSNLVSLSGLSRAIEHILRARAERRMAAVSLAAQLYRADTGRWPVSLNALVPRYLPSLPFDPMSKHPEPLRYLLSRGALPGGRDRPVVYSAGANGVFDTKDASSLPPGPTYSWNRGPDEWRDLERWKPAATQPTTTPTPGASTQAADH